jgi:hypothetical protein
MKRILLGLLAAILASHVAAASPDDVNAAASAAGLSKLDLMVIASMAESPHLLTMASYRAQKNPCASTKYSRWCSESSCGIPSFQRMPVRICRN